MPVDKIDVRALALEADAYAAKQLPDSHLLSMRYREIRDEHFTRLVMEECAKVCREKVDRDPEYGGRFGGYGPFKGDRTGPECAEAIEARMP
jgi:hypothetical protein